MEPVVVMHPVVRLAGALAVLAGFPAVAVTMLAMDGRDWAHPRRDRIGASFGGPPSDHPAGREPSSPGIGARALEAVDFGVIEVLRSLEARRPGTLRRLVGAFVEGTPERLARMEESLAISDWRALEHLAHDMKSDSGNLGARRLSALCDELQVAARDGAEPKRCVELVPRLEVEFGLVREALRSAGLVG